jgi:putative DNA primase/helicase
MTSLQDACQKVGIVYREVPADGRWHQTDAEGKHPKNGNGRIKLFADGNGGMVQNWTTMERPDVFFYDSGQTLTPAELAERKRLAEIRSREAEEETAKEQAEAAELADKVFKAAAPAIPENPYLLRKGVKPTSTLRQIALDDLIKIIGYKPQAKGKGLSGVVLIVPIGDSTGISSVEMIDGSGLKAALHRGKKKGQYWVDRKLPAGNGDGLTILVGEGAGTVLSGVEAVPGSYGVAAFSCYNLKAVALKMRERFPAAKIIILSDIGNGQAFAADASKRSGSLLAVPVMPEDSSGTDFNDLHATAGLDEVARQIALAIEPQQDAESIIDFALISETQDANPLTAAVDRLAKLSPLEYDRIRKEEAKALGVRPGTLDAAVKAAKKESETARDTPFREVEPADDPVDGAKLLDDILAAVKRFIVCDHFVAVVVTLWIAASWFADVVRVAPLLTITAPAKRCGKSTLLEFISRLVLRPLTAASITASALFRSIDLWRPTLLIDEVDACLKDNEELRGLINSGHTRGSAFTIRCTGDDHKPTVFSTWSFKVLSGIGQVADTLADRSHIVELRRKLPDEVIERMHRAPEGFFYDLCSRLARFAGDNTEAVKAVTPPLPDALNDRARDNWEPLLQVATVVGDKWLHLGFSTAEQMAGVENEAPTIGGELLADIQDIFRDQSIDRISTTDLITALVSDDEKPWLTYNRGFQIKPRQVASKLKAYGIHSKIFRINNGTARGYELAQFKEIFSRYLSTPLSKCNIVTSKQNQVVSSISKCNTDPSVTLLKSHNTSESLACYSVTHRNPPADENNFSDLTEISFEVIS